jgi:hypothetical protein
MNSKRKRNIRMGGRRAVSYTKYLVALGIVIIGLFAAMIFTSRMSIPADEPVGQVGQVGQVCCRSDQDCGTGRICALGGCLILISSEVPEVWREQLSAQLANGASWEPDPTFGEKVLATTKCPAQMGRVGRLQLDKVTTTRRVSVYEIGVNKIRVYRHFRFVGDVWIDTIRFWFPEFNKIDPMSVCASGEIDSVSIGKGTHRASTSPYIDASLLKASPAGVASAAAVSAARDQRPKQDGTSSVKLNLDAVLEK